MSTVKQLEAALWSALPALREGFVNCGCDPMCVYAQPFWDVRAVLRGPLLETPITNKTKAGTFIRRLHECGLLFHFDDSPETIVEGLGDRRTFTDAECPHVRARVIELFTHLKDPFAIALDVSKDDQE